MTYEHFLGVLGAPQLVELVVVLVSLFVLCVV